jgi:hypothetical protein
VSEIGIDGQELDLIVTGELEDAGAYIEGQLGSIDDACKKQKIIPIDPNFKVGYIPLIFIGSGEDVILYPDSRETLESESLGFSTIVGYRLQLIG